MSRIKVSVRCRPSDYPCNDLNFTNTNITTETSGIKNEFTFDEILNLNTTQDMIFKKCICPIIDKSLDGFNGCIFAYGQTGAGI